MPRNDYLRQERLKRGWSQADVAEKIGSDPKTVGRWERGITSPGPYLCQQLCDLYQKTPQELRLRPVEPCDQSAAPLMSEPSSAPASENVPARPPPPERGLKRWIRRQSQPAWITILGVCTLLVIVGIWVGARLAQPTPVAALPSADPYTGIGALAVNDPLSSNLAGWSTNTNAQGTCGFAARSYEIRGIEANYMEVCLAASMYYQNFVSEVQVRIVAGDCGGLAFRSVFPLLYYFVICQDGHYRFTRYDRDHVDQRRTILAGTSPAIHTGYNQINTIAVVASGDTFHLYINHVFIGSDTDAAYSQGQLGLMVHTCRVITPDPYPNLCDAPTDVFFSDLRVWKL